MKEIFIQTVYVSSEILAQLDNKTFQIHVLPDGKLRLYSVILDVQKPSPCPIIIGGEKCGLSAGHEGKHMWAGGD